MKAEENRAEKSEYRVFGLFILKKKKWKKEGHQVCHQVHLVPKSF